MARFDQCPGLWNPVTSKDGYLARLRLVGAVTAPDIDALTDLAENYGDGRLHLTSRAGMQIRGISDVGRWRTAISTIAKRSETTVLSPEYDRSATLLCDWPNADSKELELAGEISVLLRSLTGVLSPRFNVVLDISDANLSALPHDVAFVREASSASRFYSDGVSKYGQKQEHSFRFRMLINGVYCGLLVSRDGMVDALANVLTGDNALLDSDTGKIRLSSNFSGSAPLHDGYTGRKVVPYWGRGETENQEHFVVLTPPHARLERRHLEFMRRCARLNDCIYVLPWHAIAIVAESASRIDDVCVQAGRCGLTEDTLEKNMAVLTCCGSRGCARAKFDTIALADVIVATNTGRTGMLHVSGCDRGCGWGGNADWVVLPGADRRKVSVSDTGSASDSASDSASLAIPATYRNRVHLYSNCHPRDIARLQTREPV